MVGLIILSMVMGVISTGCFIYAYFAFHEKGPILMNDYLLATDEEKRKLARQKPEKRKKDYRFVAIVYFGLAVIFFIATIDCILSIFHIGEFPYLFIPILILVTVLIVFVITTSIKDGEFR